MVLLVGTSLVSLVILLPWQERLIEAAQGDDADAMKRGLMMWTVWGMTVMMPFTIVAWLMVAKAPLVL